MPISPIKKNYSRSAYSFANINFLGKCNLNCFFCIGKDLENEVAKYNHLNTPLKELKNLNSYLWLCRNQNIGKIYLTGFNTDPLMYKYVDDLVDHLQDEWGFEVGIRTNGILAKEKINLINRCRRSISYTVLTQKPEIMKQITGVGILPDYSWLFKNIKISQRIATVVTKQNVDELLDLIKFASNYPQIKYFQVRRIATETRYDFLKEHIEVFENLLKKVQKNFKQIDEFEKSPIFDIYGVRTSFWKTVETTVNSLNYFTNGVISDEYFIIEGYLKNKNRFLVK